VPLRGHKTILPLRGKSRRQRLILGRVGLLVQEGAKGQQESVYRKWSCLKNGKGRMAIKEGAGEGNDDPQNSCKGTGVRRVTPWNR